MDKNTSRIYIRETNTFSFGKNCLVCNESVSIQEDMLKESVICDKCKKAILYIRYNILGNETKDKNY